MLDYFYDTPKSLNDFIKQVRTCKTKQKEREMVAEEGRKIREIINSGEATSMEIGKLLFIQMLGYDVDYAIMQCIKFCANANYNDKRIGYLALAQLLNESNKECLILLCSTMYQDLMSDKPQHIISWALSAVGNLATEVIWRELSGQICTLLTVESNYVRKRACITAWLVAKLCPDLIPDIMAYIPVLVQDASHGVIMNSMKLMLEIIKIDPDTAQTFAKHTEEILRILKNLSMSKFSPDYDRCGVIDPFLQQRIIKLIRLIAVHSDLPNWQSLVEEGMQAVVAQTEGTKNPGCAVLYEAVTTVMTICESAELKQQCVKIMGRFLLNQDDSIRCISLKLFQLAQEFDPGSLFPYENTIFECMHDSDEQIRTAALKLICSSITENNVKNLTKQLLNVLIAAEPEFQDVIVANLCSAIDKHSGDIQWYVDTIIRIIALAGNSMDEDVVYSTANIILNHKSIQRYIVCKLFYLTKENIAQRSLVLLSLWWIGEFGNKMLNCQIQGPDGTELNISEADCVAFFESIVGQFSTDVTVMEHIITAMTKLACTVPQVRDRFTQMIKTWQRSMNIEL